MSKVTGREAAQKESEYLSFLKRLRMRLIAAGLIDLAENIYSHASDITEAAARSAMPVELVELGAYISELDGLPISNERLLSLTLNAGVAIGAIKGRPRGRQSQKEIRIRGYIHGLYVLENTPTSGRKPDRAPIARDLLDHLPSWMPKRAKKTMLNEIAKEKIMKRYKPGVAVAANAVKRINDAQLETEKEKRRA